MSALSPLLLVKDLRTRVQNLVIDLNGKTQQTLGGQLQTNIGLIYGFNIIADGVAPDNSTLITTTDSQNMFLTVKAGDQEIMQVIRLSDMLNEFAGSPIVRNERYMPVMLGYENFDVDVSYITNPTGITGKTVFINMWYLNKKEVKELKARGIIFNPKHPNAPTRVAPETK